MLPQELRDGAIDYSSPESYRTCLAVAKDESRDMLDRCDLLFAMSSIASQTKVKVLAPPEIVTELEDLALSRIEIDPSLRSAALSAYKYLGDVDRSKDRLLNLLSDANESYEIRDQAFITLSRLSRSDVATSRELVKAVFALDPRHETFPRSAFVDEIWQHLKKEDRWPVLGFYLRCPPELKVGFILAAREGFLPGINQGIKAIGRVSLSSMVRYAAWGGEIHEYLP